MRDNKTTATAEVAVVSGCLGCCEWVPWRLCVWAILVGHVLAASANALGIDIVENIHKWFA